MVRSVSPPISLTRRARATGEDPGFSVVWLRGDHDLTTKVAIGAAIIHAAAIDDTDVVVDLSGVTFMDAAVVGALVLAKKALNATGHTLSVRSPSSRAALLVRACGVSALLSVRPLHPAGAAPALGTWVSVPTRPSAKQATAFAGAVPSHRSTG